jgi:hypothetical protein
LAKDSLAKSLKLLGDMQEKPKTFTAHLMRLVPLIDELIADGHGLKDIVGTLKESGVEFNEASFKTSLQRARLNLKKRRAYTNAESQPQETERENNLGVAVSGLKTAPSGEMIAKKENKPTTQPTSRIVRSQTPEFVSHDKNAKLEDFV